MTKQNENKEVEQPEVDCQPTAVEGEESAEQAEATEGVAEEQQPVDPLEQAKAELEKAKNEYLFLLAEFDNFRKRTIRERAELIKNAGEKAMEGILPVVDDFERAIQAGETTDDINALREGITLIYNKFMKYLESNGVKPIESTGADFNTEYHEAVTTFPAPDESQKGKVIDTVQKGYMINDKVLRHSKVVVGQ
ncbi:MAG: nucleotide exchange factor GrpE [Bacteroidales bacterium]|nr:nucleotide exchange factor GrpE [Bacteroidales bacterium]MDD6140164.1 nucleotide exchange factor GrpE [Bacteroidales bacterium]MDD6622051.1 nucleotide exchange factor GrpE [Bacteroidales bacterium]MDD6669823.1 nucleotide exchange factor GrpE [Bacteroidales bacterium]